MPWVCLRRSDANANTILKTLFIALTLFYLALTLFFSTSHGFSETIHDGENPASSSTLGCCRPHHIILCHCLLSPGQRSTFAVLKLIVEKRLSSFWGVAFCGASTACVSFASDITTGVTCKVSSFVSATGLASTIGAFRLFNFRHNDRRYM